MNMKHKIIETDFGIMRGIMEQDVAVMMRDMEVQESGPTLYPLIVKGWGTLEQIMEYLGYDIFAITSEQEEVIANLRVLLTTVEMLSLNKKDFNITDDSFLDCLIGRTIETLIHKGKSYGQSWQKRGGVGAFMMLARKYDRIEQQMNGYNSMFPSSILVDNLPAAIRQHRNSGMIDDVQDLRNYLLLVSTYLDQRDRVEIAMRNDSTIETTVGDATKAYTSQG